MKKQIASSIIVGSLLLGGISARAQETEGTTVKSKPSSSQFQSSKAEKFKNNSISEDNLQLRDAIKLEIKQAKIRVNKVLIELKPLRKKSKELFGELRVAKEKNDKVKIEKIKGELVLIHSEIKTKLNNIQPDLDNIKLLQTELKKLKVQAQPISEQKKANSEKVKVLQQNLREVIQQAKQSKKVGNDPAAQAQLAEAMRLAEQISGLKKEILIQKTLIKEQVK